MTPRRTRAPGTDGHAFAVLLGCVLGLLGGLAPYALSGRLDPTVLDSVHSTITTLCGAACVIVPLLVVVEVTTADTDNSGRDFFLAERGGVHRLVLLRSAASTWGVVCGTALLSCILLASASAVLGPGAARGPGGVHQVVSPAVLLVLLTAQGVVHGLGLAAFFGDRQAAVAVFALSCLLLVALSAVQHLAAARLLARALPLAPVWSTLGAADVGPLALSVSPPLAALNTTVWVLLSGAVAYVCVVRWHGLPVMAWRRGG